MGESSITLEELLFALMCAGVVDINSSKGGGNDD